jgi:hypothetical protein
MHKTIEVFICKQPFFFFFFCYNLHKTLCQKFEEKQNLANNWKFCERLLFVYWTPHKGLKMCTSLFYWIFAFEKPTQYGIHPSIHLGHHLSKLPCEIYNVCMDGKIVIHHALHYLMKTTKLLWHPNQCFFKKKIWRRKWQASQGRFSLY